MLKGLYILEKEAFNKIYGLSERKDINRYVDIYAPLQTDKLIRQNLTILNEAEVIFSAWGGPKMDDVFLDAAPNLKAVFYGAGSIRGIVTDDFWDRDIIITSAYAANAIPVAEYTLSQILFSLKRGWYYVLNIKEKKKYITREKVPGAYGSTVGIISLGMIGRRICKLLKPFDISVIAYSHVSVEKADKLEVKLCSLEEVFEKADVVSLHTPWLKETEGMINGEHFQRMKKNTTFINTARGAVVREQEMIEVLKKRPDLYAVLDVTYPEPPEPNSPLYILPNVILTPHISGSTDKECRRMGRYMVEELERYVKNKTLKWKISREKFKILA